MKTLVNKQNQQIQWKFIERLYKLDQSVKSHKLTKRHIEYDTLRMNVKLAVQTISNSVAQSITALSKGLKQFQHSEGTTDFITRFNRLFYVFNSDEHAIGNIFKSPINTESKAEVLNF